MNAYKNKLLKFFAKLYPDPRSELNFKNEYELIVSVILSAQCTDKKVNEVTPILFKRFRDFKVLAQAKQSELAGIIRPINYYKTKAKNLRSMAERVVSNFSNHLPTSLGELITLPGVGRKTANVILVEQGQTPALPVDTHVFRVSRRLGLSHANTPEGVERDLTQHFAPRHWRNLHHWLIFHGRRVCKAGRPRCTECALNRLCPSVHTTSRDSK